MASLPRSVPSVREKDDVDLSDVDDFDDLPEFLRTMVMVEALSEAHGFVDMESMCIAELHLRYWALSRRQKLHSIHTARTMKRDFELVGGKTGKTDSGNPARDALKSAEAFREYFTSKGLPVIDAIV